MLKRFFISMLGTIAGFWISLLILVFAGIAIVVAAISSDTNSKVDISKNSILYIDLSGDIPERVEIGDVWQVLRDGVPSGQSLLDIINSVRHAKNDSKIEGIFINAAGSSAGFASREEIVDALKDFKDSGKWIYAYADTYAQGDYLVASLADSVFVNPVGAVDVHGIGSQTPFFTGLLEKLGIDVTIVRVGTYKSAVEPFMSKEMSPASREQTQVMIDSIWHYYTSVISEQRGVSAEVVNQWADSIIGTWRAARLESSGAVSALRYRRLVDNMLKGKCGLDADDELNMVSPAEYMLAQKPWNEDKKHIAVLFASGDIVDSGMGGIVATKMVPEILRLADDDNVQALVLRVNSGGGSGFASEQIWEALEYFKAQGKPFYVSMGDYAASGGYYISCGADRIFADRTTLTGSIGVFGMIPNLSGLVTDKLGINFSTVETNPNATFPSILTPISKEQVDALQHSVEDFYDLFTRRVAEGRDMAQDDVKKIAEGRVWVGGDALRLGLVDQLGTLNDAVNAIAKEARMDANHVVYYPKLEDKFLVTLIANAQDNMTEGAQPVSSFDAHAVAVMRFLSGLSSMNPVQARMPQSIISF